MKENNYYNDAKEFASKLRLNAIKTNLEESIEDAQHNNLSYEEFLCRLLQKEYDIREYNMTQSRLKSARFPYKKYFEDLEIESLPADAQNKLKLLNNLNFIKEGQNVNVI